MCVETPTDAELIAAHLCGDASALMALWVRYDGMVYGIAHSFTTQREAAEDIRQEVFLKVYNSLTQLQDRRRFSAWLHSITRNACNTWLRRQKPTLPVEYLTDSDHPGGSFVEAMEQREQRTRLRQMIDALPFDYRIVIELHYFEDQPITQIAGFLELTESTVKWRLFKARESLRNAAKLNGDVE